MKKYIPRLAIHTCKIPTYNVSCRACTEKKKIMEKRKAFEEMMEVSLQWDEASVML